MYVLHKNIGDTGGVTRKAICHFQYIPRCASVIVDCVSEEFEAHSYIDVVQLLEDFKAVVFDPKS